MNYYAEWWESVRNSTGILTKQTYLKQLEQRIKDLEVGKKGQAYLKLQQERADFKKQTKDLQQDLDKLQSDYHNLNADIKAREQAINDLQTEISKLESEKQNISNLSAQQVKALESEKEQIKRSFTNGSAVGTTHWIYWKNENDKIAKTNQALQILANHRLELLEQEKTALITLAKQKIKNKKEASDLVSQLESKWAKEKEELEAESAEQDQLVAQEIKNLKAKYKAKETKLQATISDLEKQKTELQSASEQELEQKKQELETQIATYKLQLENTKEELITCQTKLDLQKTRLEQQESSLQSKDNQLLGYSKVIEASAKILENKATRFSELIENLESRSKKQDLNSQQWQDLLKQDIKWLASERKELATNLQDLKTESQAATEARDEQLLVLRESLSKTESELALEQGWWDKWINEEGTLSIYRVGVDMYLYGMAIIDNKSKYEFLFNVTGTLGTYTLLPRSAAYETAFKHAVKKWYQGFRGTPTLTPILTEQSGLVTTLQSQLTASKQQAAKQALEQAKLEKAKEKLAKTKESLTKKVLELEAKLATNSPKDSLLQSLKNQLQEALAKLAKKETKDQPNPSAILKEIQQFIGSADSLDSITDWLITKDYPDLAIELNGKDPKDLLLLPEDPSAISQISKGKGTAEQWKEYTPLKTTKDGNCFLNAFSLLLVGNESLATKLRLRLCLELLSNPVTGGSESQILAEIKTKVAYLAKENNWLETGDIAYFGRILKRPIRLIYRASGVEAIANTKATNGICVTEYQDPSLDYQYSDWFTIYHSHGNHFVPLVKEEIK